MIDAIHLRFIEELMDQAIQLLRGVQVMTERLLNDRARPAGALVETGGAEASDRRRKRGGRQREIEGAVARKAIVALQRLESALERLEIRRGRRTHALIEHVRVEPRLEITRVGPGQRLLDRRAEFRVVGILIAAHAEDEVLRPDEVVLVQLIQRGE